MPQADLYFASDVDIDAARVLAQVEVVVSEHDAGAGECKGRAFPVTVTHHRNVLLQVAVLEKPHRDHAFMTGLQTKLFGVLEAMVPSPCVIAVELRFQSPFNQSKRI
ncbi:MAG: hypothetical protein AAFU79_30950 [Myxococcota bacterium]